MPLSADRCTNKFRPRVYAFTQEIPYRNKCILQILLLMPSGNLRLPCRANPTVSR